MKTLVYNYVVAFIAERGYAPSVREIATYFGISPSVAQRRVEQLVAEGWLRRGPQARSIVVAREIVER